jgi:hypothetical protein
MRVSGTLFSALLTWLCLGEVTANAGAPAWVNDRPLSAVLGAPKEFGAWWAPPLPAAPAK